MATTSVDKQQAHDITGTSLILSLSVLAMLWIFSGNTVILYISILTGGLLLYLFYERIRSLPNVVKTPLSDILITLSILSTIFSIMDIIYDHPNTTLGIFLSSFTIQTSLILLLIGIFAKSFLFDEGIGFLFLKSRSLTSLIKEWIFLSQYNLVRFVLLIFAITLRFADIFWTQTLDTSNLNTLSLLIFGLILLSSSYHPLSSNSMRIGNVVLGILILLLLPGFLFPGAKPILIGSFGLVLVVKGISLFTIKTLIIFILAQIVVFYARYRTKIFRGFGTVFAFSFVFTIPSPMKIGSAGLQIRFIITILVLFMSYADIVTRWTKRGLARIYEIFAKIYSFIKIVIISLSLLFKDLVTFLVSWVNLNRTPTIRIGASFISLFSIIFLPRSAANLGFIVFPLNYVIGITIVFVTFLDKLVIYGRAFSIWAYSTVVQMFIAVRIVTVMLLQGIYNQLHQIFVWIKSNPFMSSRILVFASALGLLIFFQDNYPMNVFFALGMLGYSFSPQILSLLKMFGNAVESLANWLISFFHQSYQYLRNWENLKGVLGILSILSQFIIVAGLVKILVIVAGIIFLLFAWERRLFRGIYDVTSRFLMTIYQFLRNFVKTIIQNVLVIMAWIIAGFFVFLAIGLVFPNIFPLSGDVFGNTLDNKLISVIIAIALTIASALTMQQTYLKRDKLKILEEIT